MSAMASATTLALPSVPTNLVATAVSGKQIALTWTASTGGLPISSYHIFQGTSPSSLSQIGVTATTSYTNRSLTPSTTYYYQVQANDSDGDTSPMSAGAWATTLPSPNTPTSLAATATSGTKISLTWTETVPPKGLPIWNYQVSCGLAPGSLGKVATVQNTSYNYTGLTAGTIYYCAVLAADTGGDLSAMAAPVPAITDALPAAPTNVTATANSSTKVTVTWTAALYVDTTVSPLATYYYAIQATDTSNEVSPMSADAEVVVP